MLLEEFEPTHICHVLRMNVDQPFFSPVSVRPSDSIFLTCNEKKKVINQICFIIQFSTVTICNHYANKQNSSEYEREREREEGGGGEERDLHP